MLAATIKGITFTAVENDATRADVTDDDTCHGCVFDSATAPTCKAACAAALEAGLPDCDMPGPLGGNVVYVRTTKGDPRQVDLAGPVTGEGDAHAT